MSTKIHKLTYFPLSGRAEAIRLSFLIGNVKFEDIRVEFKEWGALKPSTPWGSLPYLDLPTGDRLSQSDALARYAAKLAGLYPEDNIAAAKVEEVMGVMSDFMKCVNDTGKGMEQKDKEAERKKALTTGKPAMFLKKTEAYIKANGKDGHIVGGKLTLADVSLFCTTSFIISGFFDGVSGDVLKAYPSIQAVRKLVANIELVAAHYSSMSNPHYKCFAEAKDL